MADILPLFDGDNFEEDLRRLRADRDVGEAAVDLLEAFLSELAGSADAMWKLLRRMETHHSPYFNCRAIECFHARGYNVYRIHPRARGLNRFRLVYAFDAPKDEFHLLAAVLKKAESAPSGPPWTHHYGYEPDHPISSRVIDEYDRRGFARL